MSAGYDTTGVRATLMRGGTSRGLYVEARDLPDDPSSRDDLLLRLMGTPDPRQIDGVGGATALTSKVAVVGPSRDPRADVDYLFLQLGVEEATVSDRQNCGNILAGVGPFAIERGLVPAADGETVVRIRMVNSDSVAVATVSTPDTRVDYRGDVAIDGVPGTAAGITLAFTDTEGSATGALLPTGRPRDVVEGVEVTCVDNGMPVVLALASSLGLTGHETLEQLAADDRLAPRIDALRTEAGSRMGLGDVRGSPIPKTVLLAPPTDGGDVTTRSFIPIRPHSAVGVLAAISAVTGMRLPGTVGHELTAAWPASGPIAVEHAGGHLLVDVVVDTHATPPRAVRSAAVRTARTLFDGVVYPRAPHPPRRSRATTA